MSVALETLIQTNSAQKRSKKELVKKDCIRVVHLHALLGKKHGPIYYSIMALDPESCATESRGTAQWNHAAERGFEGVRIYTGGRVQLVEGLI